MKEFARSFLLGVQGHGKRAAARVHVNQSLPGRSSISRRIAVLVAAGSLGQHSTSRCRSGSSPAGQDEAFGARRALFFALPESENAIFPVFFGVVRIPPPLLDSRRHLKVRRERDKKKSEESRLVSANESILRVAYCLRGPRGTMSASALRLVARLALRPFFITHRGARKWRQWPARTVMRHSRRRTIGT